MGGVTDGQTVIRSLKSVFSAKGKGKPFIFVLYTTVTPVILLILAGLIFWQRMSNEHINCYAPPDEDIRAAAVNQYCFVTGTYTIKGYPEQLKNLKRTLPYPGVGPNIPPSALNGGGTEVKYHMYFQWVPFVLLIQAILFSVPNFVWKSLRKDTLSRYSNSIMAEDTGSAVSQTSIRFLRNLKHHYSYSGWFITLEVLNLVVATLAFLLSDLLLTGEFLHFGRDWINYLKSDNPDELVVVGGNFSANPLDRVFPKMSKCEFKKFGPGGGIINYDLLCVMTLNVFHDKVFLFLWFWLVMLMVIQFLNVFYQFVILRFKDFQCKLILARLEPAFMDDENDDDEHAHSIEIDPGFKTKAKQFLTTLGYSDWFLLRAISSSVDTEMFSKFFKCLVDQHHAKKHSRDPKANEYVHIRRNVQKENFAAGGRGLDGWKKHGACYSENLVNSLGYQNERKNSDHFTRNRNTNRGDYTQGESLYSHLNESLREMHQEEERASLLDLQRCHNNVTVIPKQQPHHSTHLKAVDIPDGHTGHDGEPSSSQRQNEKSRDYTDE